MAMCAPTAGHNSLPATCATASRYTSTAAARNEYVSIPRSAQGLASRAGPGQQETASPRSAAPAIRLTAIPEPDTGV